ncbi:response regulator [Parahaliea mediterranea]|uniref:Response regulator n=1 Tax=Parahaliea mediterranea TaxID=651086 RepID=A0A939IMN5_9GAMM|nr:response regulator [Parahaliea mediterranea]MBN7797223.1 response regulator [Parahaliea mediterranea]
MIERQLSVLVVDDHEDIRNLLSQLLSDEGYVSLTARDGIEMFAELARHKVDLILLDVMLPGTDGFDLCRELRADPAMPPVIMLTAKDQEVDRVVGLELGADDYVIKPFGKRELLARIKAVLRRVAVQPQRQGQGIYCFGDWRFDPARMELTDAEDTLVSLSASESELLLAFVQHPQVSLSRDRLLHLTKSRNSAAFDRSIDTHVSRLRRKLRDDARHPEIIKTAWGAGYILTCLVEIR